MSHYLLWRKCAELGEPILILEHDAVFLREMPVFDFQFACQINNPDGATKKGGWWRCQMETRRTEGVQLKHRVLPDDVPDGLAGNSAYVIKPEACRELIEKAHDIGLWPNDALMCRQFFPFLEEYFPFITRVEQEQSTTSR
jgi:GR25 family glycosyltransferase involved in LPS biosynthesis